MRETAKAKHTEEAGAQGEEGDESKQAIDPELIEAKIEDTHKMIDRI